MFHITHLLPLSEDFPQRRDERRNFHVFNMVLIHSTSINHWWMKRADFWWMLGGNKTHNSSGSVLNEQVRSLATAWRQLLLVSITASIVNVKWQWESPIGRGTIEQFPRLLIKESAGCWLWILNTGSSPYLASSKTVNLFLHATRKHHIAIKGRRSKLRGT